MERPKDEKSFTGWGNQSFLVISSSIVHSDSLLGRNGVMTTPTNDKEVIWQTPVREHFQNRAGYCWARLVINAIGNHPPKSFPILSWRVGELAGRAKLLIVSNSFLLILVILSHAIIHQKANCILSSSCGRDRFAKMTRNETFWIDKC